MRGIELNSAFLVSMSARRASLEQLECDAMLLDHHDRADLVERLVERSAQENRTFTGIS